MRKTHNVLLLWDIGEGAEVYRLQVTDTEFKDLRKINGFFINSDLPEELEPKWNYVNAALCSNPDYVDDEYKSISGKWVDTRWLDGGDVVRMSGDWTLVSTGAVP